MEDLFRVSCRFVCDSPVFVTDVNVSTHLYHIAREALNNAMKHGKASELGIKLSSRDDQGALSICDDGVGLPEVPKGQRYGIEHHELSRKNGGRIAGRNA